MSLISTETAIAIMTEIRFYHLQTQTLDEVLPKLLLKAYGMDKHIIVKTADDKTAEHLNKHLWTFHPDQFLPHGSKKNGNAELQPIWLTSKDENPNEAKILFLTGGATWEDMSGFDLVCEMLNGFDEDVVKAARGRWKEYKDGGYEMTYWQQNASGGWDKRS